MGINSTDNRAWVQDAWDHISDGETCLRQFLRGCEARSEKDAVLKSAMTDLADKIKKIEKEYSAYLTEITNGL